MEVPALERYQILKGVWQTGWYERFDFLKLADIFTSGFQEKLVEIWNRGGEGIVLKKKDSIYTPGKRPAWQTIKIKKHETVDLVCT